ncbi:hypothetical protein [Dyadobacter sp. LHD-138]|uniref:hypothetical protein n=1 Tax=Dyadobacter sp. LHD-138 TaxID=3071413 RepID=UPI0027E1DE33|nr:hypothetical protein [Dyadobacter sp. LHD-138]MDQ6479078.1 hypothetical protein [Dyadobacter sp. LHD-138]
MAFDLDMIKGAYARMQERVKAARKIEGRLLTLAEKMLYSHVWEGTPSQVYESDKSYFALVCVTRQDTRAHRTLL